MRSKNLIYLWLTLAVLLMDQISKIWIRSAIPLGRSISVIGKKFFLLTHIENAGITFGYKPGSPLFLIIFSSAASLFVLYLLLSADHEKSIAKPKTIRVALGLILGGAIGNLIDRISFGHVTDFLDFDFPDFIMTRWPVFNLADSAVTIGVILWIAHMIFVREKNIPEIQSHLADK